MLYREAQPADIPQLHAIRIAVTENALSNPDLITPEDYHRYLVAEGQGWVGEDGAGIVGFSILDRLQHNVWALFVHPRFEKRGIGKNLLKQLVDTHFAQTTETLWLSTAFNTRAETFYRRQGWLEDGLYGKGEQKFTLPYEIWRIKNGK